MDNLDGLTVNVNQQTIQINAVDNNITVQTQPIYDVSTGTNITKLSELENDVGFITIDDIPPVQLDQTDPIYTADKPNIALKSELFSKSYNDLTDKPELYTPTSTGDGTKFLADDGTYKAVEGGSVDLSDYTGDVNLKYESGNSYFNTSDKSFTIGTDPVNYTSQMSTGAINAGSLFNITADTLRIMDARGYGTYMTMNSGSLSLRTNLSVQGVIDCRELYINGGSVLTNPVEEVIYDNYPTLTAYSNMFLKAYDGAGYKLYSLTLNFEDQVNNFMFIFETDQFFEYTINLGLTTYFINKPFDFHPNKKYVIIANNNLLFWSEIQKYEVQYE